MASATPSATDAHLQGRRYWQNIYDDSILRAAAWITEERRLGDLLRNGDAHIHVQLHQAQIAAQHARTTSQQVMRDWGPGKHLCTPNPYRRRLRATTTAAAATTMAINGPRARATVTTSSPRATATTNGPRTTIAAAAITTNGRSRHQSPEMTRKRTGAASLLGRPRFLLHGI